MADADYDRSRTKTFENKDRSRSSTEGDNTSAYFCDQVIDLTEDTKPIVEMISSANSEKDEGITYNNETNIKEEFVILENPDFHIAECHGGHETVSPNEYETLPPPLTLDSPYPRRRGRSGKTKKKKEKNEDLTTKILGTPSSQITTQQRYQRSCKNRIVHYNEDFLIDSIVPSISVPTSKESDEEQQLLTVPKKHVCDLCNASFEKASGVTRHKIWKHSSKSQSRKSPSKIKVKAEINEFDGEVAAEIDKKTSLSIGKTFAKRLKLKEKKTYSCPQCGKQFSYRNNMGRHLRLHFGAIKKYPCPHCGKFCSSKQALIGHIRFIHTGERPYTCTICRATFVTNSDLNRHKSKHSDVKSYKCSDCGKAFKQRSALKQHMQRKLNEKSWHCGVCDKRFVSKHSLKCHMVVHTKIKLYECESCQRQFSHKISLLAHMRVHTGLMPYSCSVCGKKFAHQSNRNRHIKQVHKLIQHKEIKTQIE